MADCAGCGYVVHCIGPCAVICYHDCSRCWIDCAGHTIVLAKSGLDQVTVGFDEKAEAGSFPPKTEFRASFDGVSLADVARVLSHIHPGKLRAPEGMNEKTISDTATGTIDYLAKKYALIVE